MTPLPVHLLTGFLGSGKTTLLSHLLHEDGFVDTAVIINELGEVGLDHLLVDRGSEDGVVLLDGGCLCCALGNSLQETLEDLYYRRARGELPAFARVVIETTGVADPGPIAATLSLDRAIARHYRLSSIATTVDAIHGAEHLERFPEASRQVAVADRLVITKSDLATAPQLADLTERLAAINPHAPQTVAVRGAASARDVLMEAPLSTLAIAARTRLDGQLGRAAACDEADHVHARTDTVADPGPDHIGAQGIATTVIRLDVPLAWQRYANWVTWVQRALGDGLLRMKGAVRMDDGELRVLHAVMRLFNPPEPIADLPLAFGQGIVVLITQGLSASILDEAKRRLSEGS